MNDNDDLNELIHLLINKALSVQSLIKLLEKTQLDEKQRSLIDKTLSNTNEVISTSKKIREQARN